MRVRRCVNRLSALVSLLISASSVIAQSPLPTNTELRAAYCITVLQHEIGTLTSSVGQAQQIISEIQTLPTDLQPQVRETMQSLINDYPARIAERENTLNRLQLYLIPRTKYLDANAILAATSRAKSDLQDLRALSSKCLPKCNRQQRDPAVNEACLRNCMSGELEERIAACRTPSWLPF